MFILLIQELQNDVSEIDMRLCDRELSHAQFATLTALKNKLLDSMGKLNGLDIAIKVAENTALAQASTDNTPQKPEPKRVSYTPQKRNARKSHVIDVDQSQ